MKTIISLLQENQVFAKVAQLQNLCMKVISKYSVHDKAYNFSIVPTLPEPDWLSEYNVFAYSNITASQNWRFQGSTVTLAYFAGCQLELSADFQEIQAMIKKNGTSCQTLVQRKIGWYVHDLLPYQKFQGMFHKSWLSAVPHIMHLTWGWCAAALFDSRGGSSINTIRGALQAWSCVV